MQNKERNKLGYEKTLKRRYDTIGLNYSLSCQLLRWIVTSSFWNNGRFLLNWPVMFYMNNENYFFFYVTIQVEWQLSDFTDKIQVLCTSSNIKKKMQNLSLKLMKSGKIDLQISDFLSLKLLLQSTIKSYLYIMNIKLFFEFKIIYQIMHRYQFLMQYTIKYIFFRTTFFMILTNLFTYKRLHWIFLFLTAVRNRSIYNIIRHFPDEILCFHK